VSIHIGVEELLNGSKYVKIYMNLISTRKNRKIDGSIEKHHIIPKSLGGTNKKDNIIELTPKEHFIAHLLLEKSTSGTLYHSKMAFALTRIVHGNKKNYTMNSRKYQYIKKLNAKYSSIRSKKWWDTATDEMKMKRNEKFKGENNYMYGKTHSTETKNIISNKAKKRLSDKKNHPMYNKNHSEKTKRIISEKKNALHLNYKWYHNPELEQERLCSVCPDEWMLGRLPGIIISPKASLGKKWYHNPITKTEKYFIVNQQLKNFILGRLRGN
jgi:hypothetical protein